MMFERVIASHPTCPHDTCALSLLLAECRKLIARHTCILALRYQYTTSLHWSLTQFTPASMEVVPTNAPERTYTSCVIIFALVIFSSFVSAITGSVTALQQARERSLRNQMLLRRYLSERGVSTALVFRICHYAQAPTGFSSILY